MLLPEPRGPLSTALVDALRTDDPTRLPLAEDIGDVADAIADDDLQLTLWTCYELHYRGFDEVDDLWEWHPDVIALRLGLEAELLSALHREVRVPASDRPVAERLRALVDGDDGPEPVALRPVEGQCRAVQRIRHPPLAVPAEGSRKNRCCGRLAISSAMPSSCRRRVRR